jgi:hypothetical protein
MYMLYFWPAVLDVVGNEDVVQLLVALVKNVGISFDNGYFCSILDFDELLCQGREDSAGLREFVEVTSDDDVCIAILVEYRFDEGLKEESASHAHSRR